MLTIIDDFRIAVKSIVNQSEPQTIAASALATTTVTDASQAV